MSKKYPGLITIDPSVLTVDQRNKMQVPVLARMANEEIYDPEVDAAPDAAAQLDYVEEMLERSLLSFVQAHYKRARVSAAQVDDPADEL